MPEILTGTLAEEQGKESHFTVGFQVQLCDLSCKVMAPVDI